uniref:Uncharacterized protein n=1 Tax=Pfiesteria piscicida TaxID=71001 RepID=E8Z6H4_PFIPI|nr:unknown [Pfiesteria piscicida]
MYQLLTTITTKSVMDGSKSAVAFFVLFFIVANLIVLDILVALILDCFMTLSEEERVARLSDGVDAEVSFEGRSFMDGESPDVDMGGSSPLAGFGARRGSVPLLRSRWNAGEMLRRVLLAEDEEFVETSAWLATIDAHTAAAAASQDRARFFSGGSLDDSVTRRHSAASLSSDPSPPARSWAPTGSG